MYILINSIVNSYTPIILTIINTFSFFIIYRCGSIPKNITDAQVLYAKQIYENAFHPDTAEKQNVFGRLSFMPIGKGILIATLLTQLS